MTGLQSFPTAPTAVSDFDPYRFPAVYIDDLAEETPAAYDIPSYGDHPLPPPAPASRLSVPLEPADRRRLELHAALTTAGIAPLPGDLDAIEALCALDDFTHIALQRWITRNT
ncbi:hypothetical protein [Streptomyces vilmorinianum]|uniref:hypothetical protein n=1 Tax=Streptomyces vilmorinianum TaxID=3051092 RepID=UPI0010FAE2CC|nr:hypothetical protein [Streptomyces vilmorinianum]